MRSRPFVTLTGATLTAAAVGLMFALAGCSGHVEAGPSVSGARVAETAAKALEAKVGTKPDIDCGTDDIIVVKGKKITCELTDDGLAYDVAVTFTKVKGTTYSIDVKVADTPKNAPSPTVSAGSGGSAPTVPGTDIAALAVEALTPQLGFTPEITCPDAQVAIAVGNKTSCTFTESSGSKHDVAVTITEFDGSHYTIDAKITD